MSLWRVSPLLVPSLLPRHQLHTANPLAQRLGHFEYPVLHWQAGIIAAVWKVASFWLTLKVEAVTGSLVCIICGLTFLFSWPWLCLTWVVFCSPFSLSSWKQVGWCLLQVLQTLLMLQLFERWPEFRHPKHNLPALTNVTLSETSFSINFLHVCKVCPFTYRKQTFW